MFYIYNNNNTGMTIKCVLFTHFMVITLYVWLWVWVATCLCVYAVLTLNLS